VPYRGATLFQAIDEKLTTLASGAGVSMRVERAEFAASLSVFCEGFRAALIERFDTPDNPPGKAMQLLRQMLKLNVSYWWQEPMRRAALLALRNLLGSGLRHSFVDLDPAFASVLLSYGIDVEAWDAMRQGDSHSSAIAEAAADRLDNYLWDRLFLVALGSDTHESAPFGRAAADFTAEGELLRFMAQLRDFRAAFLATPLGVATANREIDLGMQSALAQGDILAGMSNFIIWIVLLARLENYASEAEQGATEMAEPNEWPWFDAAIASGALGLCADFLFGETTGLNQLSLRGYAAPRHSSIDSALELWRRARCGDDVRAALAEWARDEDDGQLDTLQVTRQALNYALLHHLQNMMEPGYLPRTLQRMRALNAEAHFHMPGARQ
jgi:hypothetical protein